MPMLLNADEVSKLQGQIDILSLKEVEEVYLPLSRLLNLYANATQKLYDVTGEFLGHTTPKVPYIIGIAGSVAVGKSTVSRILQALLSRWPEHRRVDIVTTDGFLFPNKVLEERDLMMRKGFPESYDIRLFIRFLSNLKAGIPKLKIPVYSHHNYDIIPNTFQTIDRPDIIIVEGLNVLQVGTAPLAKKGHIFVSDFFDFSIYVDAVTEHIKRWFLDRFELFRSRASTDPSAFFYQFSLWDREKALKFADEVWTQINEKNLYENILPYKERARLILCKGKHHGVEKILLRKL